VFRQLNDTDAVVTEIQDVLLKEEAAYLIDVASREGWNDSTIVTNGHSHIDRRRTSKSAFLKKNADPVLDCIGKRIATLAGQPTTHMEPFQVTDYTHKQQYKPHHDYLNNRSQSERTVSVFAYLDEHKCSEGKCGGSTTFNNLIQPDGNPLRVYPKVGNAVMWSNRNGDGSVNPSTLHSGEKLICENSHKIGLNVWFRDQAWT
jgi:prolyl 4-hydroxylase